MIRSAGDDDRGGDEQRDDRVEPVRAGDLDEHEADEHADRGVGVGAQVGGVALERGGARSRARGGTASCETARLATVENADHRDADAEVLELAGR